VESEDDDNIDYFSDTAHVIKHLKFVTSFNKSARKLK
jgi:hypothetical protein